MALDVGAIRWSIEVDPSDLENARISMERVGDTARQGGKDAEQMGRKLDKTGRDAKRMGGGMDNAAKSVKRLAAGFLGLEAARRAITSTIRVTANFEKSISNLAAITGATGKDLEFYSEQAKEIGRTTSLSASQAAEGFKLIASAKPDLLESADSLAAVTKEAVTLAEATGISLPASAAALGSALNQFQLPASDANRVINALAASSQLGTAEVGAVTEAMRNAGAAANSLGLDFEETVAGIQALAASGRQGADAGTALRQVLLRLEETADKRLQPSVVGLGAALEELKGRNLDNTQLMDLFGQEAFTAAASLLAQSDVVLKLNDSLRGTQIATEQAATNMDNLTGDFLAAKSATEALQIAIGETSDGGLRGITQSYTETVSLLSQNLDTVGRVSAAVAVTYTASFIPAIAASTAAAVTSTGAMATLGARLAFLASPAGGFALAAGALATLAVGFKEVRDRVDEARESMFRLHTAGIRSTELRMAELAKEILSANRQLEALERLGHAGAKRIQEKRDRVDELVAEMERLAESLKDQREAEEEANRTTADSIELMDAHVRAMEAARSAAEALTDEQEKNRQSVADLIRELEIQATSLDMTARSAAIYQAVMKATAEGVLPEQIARVAELTAEIWDQNAAQEAAAETVKKTSKERTAAEEAAAQASQDNWQRTHEFVTDTILDIADEGGNAFEKLGDVAVNTAKRIAAEWLALKGLNLFGFEAPAGALASGGFGGGPMGSLATTGINALGTALTTGAGGFSLGAIGSTTGGWVAPSMVAPGAAGAAGGAGAGGIMSSVGGFLTSPVGIAAMVGIAGKLIHDATNDPDGRHRGMAGFLSGSTPGAPGSSQFSVSPFASGFAPTGFADGPVTRQQAEQLIDQFRFIDQTIVEAVTEAGGRVARPGTLGGFGLEGTGAGTFFGMSDITTEQQFNRQLDSFASQLADHIEGLTPETMAQLAGASSAQEIVNILGEVSGANDELADRVTSLVDSNDFVVDSQGNLIDSNGAVVATMQQLIAVQGEMPGRIQSSLRAAYAEANAPAAARVNQAVAGRDPGMVFGEPGDPGTHFVDGVQVNPLTFAESKRRERVADNLRMSEMGFNFQTGEWESQTGMNKYYTSRREEFLDGSFKNGLDRVPFDGFVAELHQGERVLTADEARGMGGLESEMGQLMRAMVKQAARTAKILERWEGDGLPTERT